MLASFLHHVIVVFILFLSAFVYMYYLLTCLLVKLVLKVNNVQLIVSL